jgi:hypothetical protein
MASKAEWGKFIVHYLEAFRIAKRMPQKEECKNGIIFI